MGQGRIRRGLAEGETGGKAVKERERSQLDVIR